MYEKKYLNTYDNKILDKSTQKSERNASQKKKL